LDDQASVLRLGAMSAFFQCEYCGHLAPIEKAIMAWSIDEDRHGPDPDDEVSIVEVTCGVSCAEMLITATSLRR